MIHRAALYLRQSLDASGEGLAVQRQHDDCLRVCRERGWTVVSTFIDNAVSASSGKPRPQYQAMLEAIRAGRIDTIVVWDLDRLTRRPVEVEDWIEMSEKHGVNLVTIGESIDLSTDNGRLFLRIKAAVARAEMERKGARQRRANLSKAKAGDPAGGHRPFGFQPARKGAKQQTEAAEAKLISEAYTAFLSGVSLRSIARTWNEAGTRTSRGSEWRPDSVRYVLANPRNAAIRYRNGERVGPATWKPIVPEEVWQSAVATLSQSNRLVTPGNARRYWLSGIAVCGLCEAKMTTGRTQKKVRALRCSKSNHLVRAAEPIEDLVAELIVARMSDPDAQLMYQPDTASDAPRLRGETATLRQRLDGAAVMWARGQINDSQLETINSTLMDQIADLERQMQTTHRTDVLAHFQGAASAQAVWDAMDPDVRHAVAATLMDVTLMSPGRGRRTLDPSTVRVSWHTA